MPNAFDQFDAPAESPAANPFDQFDPPKAAAAHPERHLYNPTTWDWPGIGEFVKRTYVDPMVDAVTLPRDVLEGKVAPMSPEGRARALNAASVMLPAGEFAGTGAQIARGAAKPEFKAATPGIKAAETAAGLDAPLPAGLVSDNRATQALTQASRSMPLVGAKIDERVGKTIENAGKAINEMAENLSGGVPDRATAGANLRPSLQGVINDNNGKIDQAYRALRHVIDPDAVSPVSRTGAALTGIMGERVAARMAKPESGLQDIIKLIKNGASFNGLQRARADVGKIIGLAENNPNPGFNVGDFKRIYAAMSGDMEGAVRANATVHPDLAANVLREANKVADTLIDRNKNMQTLLHPSMSNESMVGSVINAAREKGGNARLLAQLRQQMPKQDFEQIVGVALSEMGHNPATDKFSLEKFGTSWRNLGDTAKSVLFPDPAHRTALDGIAHLDKVLKESDKYINKSQTGRVDTLTKIIGGAGAAAGAIASGNIPALLSGLAAGAGGYGLAKYLARPATASALHKWATVAQDKATGRYGTGKVAALGLAGRNLITNLRDISGFNDDQGGPVGDRARTAAQRMPPRKIQDRIALPTAR
jgi:hypothetical protein